MAKKQAMENDGFFAVIRWHELDIRKLMELRGVPATEKNMEVFLNSIAPEVLKESSVKHGWEVLANAIDGMLWTNMFEGTTDPTQK